MTNFVDLKYVALLAENIRYTEELIRDPSKSGQFVNAYNGLLKEYRRNLQKDVDRHVYWTLRDHSAQEAKQILMKAIGDWVGSDSVKSVEVVRVITIAREVKKSAVRRWLEFNKWNILFALLFFVGFIWRVWPDFTG